MSYKQITWMEFIYKTKSPNRVFSYKQVTFREFSYKKSYPVESSATNKSSSREYGYKQITLCRVQLQTNHTLESSATLYKLINQQRIQLQASDTVESSATSVTKLCSNYSIITSYIVICNKDLLSKIATSWIVSFCWPIEKSSSYSMVALYGRGNAELGFSSQNYLKPASVSLLDNLTALVRRSQA